MIANLIGQPESSRKGLFLGCFLVVVVLLTLIALSSPLSPVRSVLKTIGFIVTGRLHFPKRRLGQVVTDEAGRQFTVFREVVVDPPQAQPADTAAVLILHFKVANMSPQLNKLYSVLPLPLYIGNPGFRSKLFTINGEDCQSIYEWDTVQDAENYVQSMALKTIIARAAPGSVSCQIVAPPKQEDINDRADITTEPVRTNQRA